MWENLLKERAKILLLLHMILAVYSISGIFSKMAAGQPFLSSGFCIYYAAGWQQIIKYLPLTAAFANKAVTVVWGMVWGIVFFEEPVTKGKATGALLVIIGIFIYAGAGGKKEGGQYNR